MKSMEFLSLLNIQLPPELKVMAGCFFSNHTSFIQRCWCHNRLLHACFDWHGNVYTWKLLCCLWVVSLSWGTVGTRSAREGLAAETISCPLNSTFIMDLAMRTVVAGSMDRRASVDTAVVTAIVNKNPRNLNNNLYSIKEKKEVRLICDDPLPCFVAVILHSYCCDALKGFAGSNFTLGVSLIMVFENSNWKCLKSVIHL